MYQTLYSTEQKELIFPSVRTKYHRITLCSKNNDERVTIDFNLHFEDLRPHATKKNNKTPGVTSMYDVPNLVMIESKSMSDHCISSDIMKSFDIPTAKACSKYCLGLYYFEKVKEWSTFQDTINMIEQIKRAKNAKELENSETTLAQILPQYQTQELIIS